MCELCEPWRRPLGDVRTVGDAWWGTRLRDDHSSTELERSGQRDAGRSTTAITLGDETSRERASLGAGEAIEALAFEELRGELGRACEVGRIVTSSDDARDQIDDAFGFAAWIHACEASQSMCRNGDRTISRPSPA